MHRVISASLMVVVALAVIAAPVGAGRSWCRADPIVRFNGTEVQFWVAIPSEYEHLVNGPIEFNFLLAHEVEREVTFTDDGFNGHGEVIKFHDEDDPEFKVKSNGKFRLDVRAVVPLDKKALAEEFGQKTKDIPMHLIVIDADGKETVIEGTNEKTTTWFVVQGSTVTVQS